MTIKRRFARLEKQSHRLSWVLTALCAFAGCGVPPSRTNQLSIGMTKQEAISVMGQPMSTAAPGNGVEILRYHLYDAWGTGIQMEYFVRIVNGKVDSYGKVGDFDSTKDPTLDVNIRQR